MSESSLFSIALGALTGLFDANAATHALIFIPVAAALLLMMRSVSVLICSPSASMLPWFASADACAHALFLCLQALMLLAARRAWIMLQRRPRLQAFFALGADAALSGRGDGTIAPSSLVCSLALLPALAFWIAAYVLVPRANIVTLFQSSAAVSSVNASSVASTLIAQILLVPRAYLPPAALASSPSSYCALLFAASTGADDSMFAI